jgi:hypothetical protein
VDNCENILKDPSRKADLENDLSLLHNELAKDTAISRKKFAELDYLTPAKFDLVVSKRLKTYLDSSLKKSYSHVYNKANNDRDAAVVALTKKIGEDNFNKLKNEYDNESLDDLVKNAKDLDKIVEVDGKLIQRYDPVFLDPSKSSFISAHFFAPRKRMFGQYMDTFWVNMIVIWTMSLALAITLYFDVLKKFIDFFGDFSSRFKRKKKE